ncbi:MAG: hypothetical protein ACR2KJ_04060 [Jatrophihabitans sp.]
MCRPAILFAGHDLSAESSRFSDLDTLQEAEEAFLAAMDHPGGLPLRSGFGSG